MLEVIQIPVLTDNYVYLIHEPESKQTAVVDPAVADPVLTELDRRGWVLTHVLNTHHHWDHVGANLELKGATGCFVVGFRGDAVRIPGIDRMVGEEEFFEMGARTARILEVPGHTRGHIAYWFEDDEALFCGDTLFALGCGRLFEGTAGQMWNSLCKLRDLPDPTRVYCAHEYTLGNARFAKTIEPDYPPLIERVAQIERLRAVDRPTVPSLMVEERRTNPFLRADDPGLQASLSLQGVPAVEVFAELRRRKDRFRG